MFTLLIHLVIAFKSLLVLAYSLQNSVHLAQVTVNSTLHMTLHLILPETFTSLIQETIAFKYLRLILN